MSGFHVPGPNLEALEPETNFVRPHAQGADQEFPRLSPVRDMVDGMLVLAHRGANRLAPENTVPAMREAVDRGADGVELDVHRSADGGLGVRHDATDAPDVPAGPEVPMLAEVLDVCRGRLVNVEIKDPHATDDVVALLADRGDDQVLVSAFDWDVVDRVRELAPHLPTGLLSFGVPPDEVLVTAVLRGHTAVHPDVWTLHDRSTSPGSSPGRTTRVCR